MDYMESRITRAKAVLILGVLLFILFAVLVPVLVIQPQSWSDELDGYGVLYVVAIPIGLLVLWGLTLNVSCAKYDLLDEQRSLGMRD